MVVSLRIHRFSYLSRCNLETALSGGDLMKLTIVIVKLMFEVILVLHRFKCLATVVLRPWSMSLKCP